MNVLTTKQPTPPRLGPAARCPSDAHPAAATLQITWMELWVVWMWSAIAACVALGEALIPH